VVAAAGLSEYLFLHRLERLLLTAGWNFSPARRSQTAALWHRLSRDRIPRPPVTMLMYSGPGDAEKDLVGHANIERLFAEVGDEANCSKQPETAKPVDSWRIIASARPSGRLRLCLPGGGRQKHRRHHGSDRIESVILSHMQCMARDVQRGNDEVRAAMNAFPGAFLGLSLSGQVPAQAGRAKQTDVSRPASWASRFHNAMASPTRIPPTAAYALAQPLQPADPSAHMGR